MGAPEEAGGAGGVCVHGGVIHGGFLDSTYNGVSLKGIDRRQGSPSLPPSLPPSFLPSFPPCFLTSSPLSGDTPRHPGRLTTPGSVSESH